MRLDHGIETISIQQEARWASAQQPSQSQVRGLALASQADPIALEFAGLDRVSTETTRVRALLLAIQIAAVSGLAMLYLG